MTPRLLPPSRPQITATEARDLLEHRNALEDVALLAIRGYFRDTMGVRGVNDRGCYDDAIIVVTPTAFATFNANTDPSVARRGIAVLEPGVWRYQRGRHKQFSPLGYAAFVQAAPVTVLRDRIGPDTGWFGINIHKGAYASTSSEGCQTLWPEQWEAFRSLVYGEMDRHHVSTLPYCLIHEDSRR